MATIFRFVQIFSLSTWTGCILFLTLIVAPGAFATLPTREIAGAMVGMALTRLHFLGYIAGGIFLIATCIEARGVSALARPAAVLVIAMLLLTILSQQAITPRIASLRAQMSAAHGSIDATPTNDPLRAQFGKLHGLSTLLELVVLLLGLAALFLTVRNFSN